MVPEGLSVAEAQCLDCEFWTPAPNGIVGRKGFPSQLGLDQCVGIEIEVPGSRPWHRRAR